MGELEGQDAIQWQLVADFKNKLDREQQEIWD
jgi:hypothetical protein